MSNNEYLATTKSPLLIKMLSKIVKVDFRELVGNGGENDESKITKPDKVVCVVDHVLNLAIKNSWGLCKMNGFIYAYNGAFWELIDNDEFQGFLGDAAFIMGLSRNEAKYFGFQDNLFKQFMASARLTTDRINRRETLINLENGTFAIASEEEWELRPFNRNDALTYQLPFEYNRSATAPGFHSYLDRVLPDKDLQAILAEFIGYIFIKNLKLEKCLLLYGSGANGKSVFFDIINALLGKENISNFSLGNLSEENNRALISNKLLNYGSEIRSNIETDIFKQLVSGEPVQCRLKYGNSFILSDYAKLCFNCNELPKEVEHNEAFFRRFLIVPFDVTIPEGERDPELANEIIATELAGVFNWVLAGLKRVLFHRDFTRSEAASEALKTYKQQSDSVYLFLEDAHYVKSDTKSILVNVIYPSYKQFCRNDTHGILGKTNFTKRLKNLGYEVVRRNDGMHIYMEQDSRVHAEEHNNLVTEPDLDGAMSVEQFKNAISKKV